MPVLFNGRINVDIRDSEPDWTSVRAAEGARGGAECLVHRAR